MNGPHKGRTYRKISIKQRSLQNFVGQICSLQLISPPFAVDGTGTVLLP